MALFHIACKIISRSDGRNAVVSAAYRAGMRLTCPRTGRVANYTRKREVSHREISAPADAPAWVQDRAALWGAIEMIETRKNAQVAREVQVALPLELTPRQHTDLLRGFVDKAFVGLGMVADWNIHAKEGNPHCHIMLTKRSIGPGGFAGKVRAWDEKRQLEDWRRLWAEHCNQALAAAGSDARVDHRSLAAQGIKDRNPTQHLGRDNGLNSIERAEKQEHNALQRAKVALATLRQEQEDARQALEALESEILDLKTSLVQALAERRMPQPLDPIVSPVLSLDEAHEMRAAQPPPGGLVLPWSRVAHAPGATPENNHQPHGGVKP